MQDGSLLPTGKPGSLLRSSGPSSRSPELAPSHPAAAAKRGAQLHLLGSETPPPRPPSASGSLCPPPQGTGGPREMDPAALPSLSPLTNRAGGGQQPHPGACVAPGGAGAAPACGCAPQNPFAPGCSLHTAPGSTLPTGTPPSSRTVRGPPGTLGGGSGATRGQHRPGAAAPGMAAAGRTAAARRPSLCPGIRRCCLIDSRPGSVSQFPPRGAAFRCLGAVSSAAVGQMAGQK